MHLVQLAPATDERGASRCGLHVVGDRRDGEPGFDGLRLALRVDRVVGLVLDPRAARAVRLRPQSSRPSGAADCNLAAVFTTSPIASGSP